MKRKPPKISRHVKWTPFGRCDTWSNPETGKIQPIPEDMLILKNNVYTVTVEECEPVGDGPYLAVFPARVTWLSIKRNDRQPMHDWRELQRIKNEICGPEREAVEIYPAESRLVDSSNQYHLFVLPEGMRLPFGYAERMIVAESGGGAEQRSFAAGTLPDDAQTNEQVVKRMERDGAYGARLVHRRVPTKWEQR